MECGYANYGSEGLAWNFSATFAAAASDITPTSCVINESTGFLGNSTPGGTLTGSCSNYPYPGFSTHITYTVTLHYPACNIHLGELRIGEDVIGEAEPQPSLVFIKETIKKAEVVIPNFRLATIEKSDNFEWRLTDTSPIGNLQRVSQMVQEGSNGNTLSLIYTGSKGVISLQTAVNMLRVSPCKAYRVSIQVMVQ